MISLLFLTAPRVPERRCRSRTKCACTLLVWHECLSYFVQNLKYPVSLSWYPACSFSSFLSGCYACRQLIFFLMCPFKNSILKGNLIKSHTLQSPIQMTLVPSTLILCPIIIDQGFQPYFPIIPDTLGY